MTEYNVEKVHKTIRNVPTIYYSVSRVEEDYEILEKEYDTLEEVEIYIILKEGIIKEYKEYERVKTT